MLSEKQINYIFYWERVRDKESSFIRKLTGGLPMAMIFGLPILLFILIVYIFFPDWYMKISATTSGTFGVVVVAVMILIIFFSYFRMHFKWEMNEQLYLELKHKKVLEEKAANHK